MLKQRLQNALWKRRRLIRRWAFLQSTSASFWIFQNINNQLQSYAPPYSVAPLKRIICRSCLLHTTVGEGLPNARHESVTLCPSRTSTADAVVYVQHMEVLEIDRLYSINHNLYKRIHYHSASEQIHLIFFLYNCSWKEEIRMVQC